jgi:hypothetical protein
MMLVDRRPGYERPVAERAAIGVGRIVEAHKARIVS